LEFDVAISNPESLFDRGYDVVILAGGRHSLPDKWRIPRGFDMCESNAEETLTIKFVSGPGALCDRSVEESSLARAVGGGKVFIRPGATEDQGWVWVLGLPSEFAERARAKLASRVTFTRFSELQEVLGDLFERSACSVEETAGEPTAEGGSEDAAPSATASTVQPGSPKRAIARELNKFADGMRKLADGTSIDPVPIITQYPCSPKAAAKPMVAGEWLAEGFKLLDDMLKPTSVQANVTTAAYWRSSEVVHQCKHQDGTHRGWLVLAGDSACGKPFHTGANLNGHFADTVSLVRGTSWSNWEPEGQPFRKYVEQCRVRTSTAGFKKSFHS